MGWSSKFKKAAGGVLDPLDITGRKAGAAAKDAARAQKSATRDQIAYMQEAEQRALARTQPFVDFGTQNMEALQGLMTPEGQMAYLQNNPMFSAAVESAQDKTMAMSAALGRANSGGTVDQLFKNYLSLGDQFVGNQYNRLLNPVQLGQNAAVGQASNIMNTGTNVGSAYGAIGDINAAKDIAETQARQQGLQTLMQLGGYASGGGFGGFFG